MSRDSSCEELTMLQTPHCTMSLLRGYSLLDVLDVIFRELALHIVIKKVKNCKAQLYNV